MRPLVIFFRANPQAFILLLICLILGLGTFIAVLISLGGSAGGTPQGQVVGLVAPAARALF